MAGSDDFCGWIGRKSEDEDILTPRIARTFTAALAPWLPPGPVESSGLIHWCLAPPTASGAELGTDGHPSRTVLLPGAPLPRRMWVGGELRWYAPLRIGDAIIRQSRVVRANVKKGRSGTLAFVSIAHDLRRNDELLIEERQDLVFREWAPSPPPTQPEPASACPPPKHDLAWDIEATPALLFRYSALTFNTHRIHYDLPYARDVEAYAGLVVQGPLQATLLHHLAATLAGTSPRFFSYRAVSPLIAGQAFKVSAARNGMCQAIAADGTVTMSARFE